MKIMLMCLYLSPSGEPVVKSTCKFSLVHIIQWFLICTGKNLFQDKGVLSFVFNDITSALRWIQDISYKDKLDADQYQTQEKIRACGVSKSPVFHFCYPYPIHMMLWFCIARWKLSNSKCTESEMHIVLQTTISTNDGITQMRLLDLMCRFRNSFAVVNLYGGITTATWTLST